ncbi:MAG: SMEK domain-containing protein, partial [Exiguobacterium acetylicum]
DKEFIKAQTKSKNQPAIDLIDEHNKIAMQITSDGSNGKIKGTIEMFEKMKLNKKYNTLYHFVVGEKHYNEKSQGGFKKAELNIFYKDNNEDENEKYPYQIVLFDLYDLILKIDEQNNEKVSEIHSYIMRSIRQPLNELQRNYYSIDTEDVTPFDAASLIDFYSIDKDYIKEFQKDLLNLANCLNNLEKGNSRKFLYEAINLIPFEDGKTRHLEIDPIIVGRKLNLNHEELGAELKILFHYEIADADIWDYEQKFVLNYTDSAGNELLFDIYSYCKLNDINLKSVFYDVDFSLLN